MCRAAGRKPAGGQVADSPAQLSSQKLPQSGANVQNVAMTETPPPFQNVAVLGAGSFGTALALVLAGNKLPVTLWGHTADAMERMAAARENTTYLPGVALPPELRLTSKLADV